MYSIDNKPTPKSGESPPISHALTRRFVPSRYGQTHLRTAGESNQGHLPVVCLHMLPQSSRSLAGFVRELGQSRPVLAPDFPGYGESDAPPKPISATEYAESIWESLAQLLPESDATEFDLFGIHGGAKLAVAMASLRPQRIRRIVLSSAAVMSDQEIAPIKAALTPTALDEHGSRFQAIWQMLLKARSEHTSFEMLANAFAEIVRRDHGYEWGHFAVFDYNQQFVKDIRSLQHPITLLNPGDGLYEMTPRTLQYIQNGELIDKPEWGFDYLQTHTDEAVDVVSAALDANTVSFIPNEFAKET